MINPRALQALTPPSPRSQSMNLLDPRPSNSAPTEPDRRQEDSDLPIRLETTDLSRGGCYIQLISTLPLGARMHVTLWLGGYPVVIQGRVVTRHHQFGNGIMFLEFEGEGDQLLNRYLEAITT